MVRDNEKIISVAVNDEHISRRLTRLLSATEYVPTFIDADDIMQSLPGIFCLVIDLDALEEINAEKTSFFESINHRSPNTGIILITDSEQHESYHRLLATENVLVSDWTVSDEIFEHNIMSFLGILQKAFINSAVSHYILSDEKTYSIPNDLQLVRPVTEHLIRDLFNMGLVTSDELFNVKFGVQEMIVNAIEHGNLGITYEEKSVLLDNGEDIGEFIHRRAANPQYADKKVTIKYILTPNFVKYVITDEGEGFNYHDIPIEITDENFKSVHGRGIIMSRAAFDEFYYNDKGNEVTMVIYSGRKNCKMKIDKNKTVENDAEFENDGK
ncbi:MAG: ATP-binding protein [Spirochaetales bacterium]|nr:ATP-binding protein [Spirochaetales bacterium]